MATVRQRVLTGTTLAAAVLLLLLLDRLLPVGLVAWSAGAGLLALCVWELGRMGTLASPRLRRVLAGAGVGAMGAGGALLLTPAGGPAWAAAAVYGGALAGGLAGLPAGSTGPADAAPSGGRALLLALLLAPPFALLALFERAHGVGALGLLVLLAKVGDVFGYFVGRAIGVRHPFPRISPNKTVAGCVASLVAAIAAGLVAGVTGALGAGPAAGAALGAAINLSAQASDLLESGLKRHAGVKDSSTLAGASGGVLDVVDSLLLAVPVAALLWPLLAGPG